MPPFGGQAGVAARSWLRVRGGLGHVSQTRPVLKDRLAPAFACEAQISLLEPSLSDFVRSASAFGIAEARIRCGVEDARLYLACLWFVAAVLGCHASCQLVEGPRRMAPT